MTVCRRSRLWCRSAGRRESARKEERGREGGREVVGRRRKRDRGVGYTSWRYFRFVSPSLFYDLD